MRDLEKVHVFPETTAVCRALDLDPLGTIASGALLVTAAPQESYRMIDALAVAGIQATVIGRVVKGSPAVWMRSADSLANFPIFQRDELARLFEESA